MMRYIPMGLKLTPGPVNKVNVIWILLIYKSSFGFLHDFQLDFAINTYHATISNQF